MADPIITQAQNFITQAQTYASTALNQALEDVEKAVSFTSNAQLIPLDPVQKGAYAKTDFILNPFSKGDIPTIENMNLIIDPYLKKWFEKFDYVMDKYFSNILSFGLSEKELQNILQNGYTIKKEIANQIISRGMDTENAKLKNTNEQITLEFLSKGFSIPNFMLLNRLDRAQQDYNNQVSQLNRDLAIKLQELQTDMLKFAVNEGVNLLPKCIQIASQFSSQYAQVFSFGVESAKAYISGLAMVNDSNRIYETAVTDVMKSQINEIELYRNYDLDSKYKQAEFALQKVDLNAKTTISGVDALTRIGTAGLQAQQSIVNLTSAGITNYTG